MKTSVLLFLIFVLNSCVIKNSKKPHTTMYVITVLEKRYNPLTDQKELESEIDTIYKENDLDAYFEGENSFQAATKAVKMLGKKGAELMQPISFSVINADGVDISTKISKSQKDSIRDFFKKL